MYVKRGWARHGWRLWVVPNREVPRLLGMGRIARAAARSASYSTWRYRWHTKALTSPGTIPYRGGILDRGGYIEVRAQVWL